MARATVTMVQSVIKTAPAGTIDLDQFIQQAHILTNRVSAAGLTDADTLAAIETNLAAHFYSLRDPQYQSKKTGDASGQFMAERTQWLEAALMFDTTGTLAAMIKGHNIKPEIIHLGTAYSERADWWTVD